MTVRKKIGLSFQGGALIGSMSVGENVALPLREHTQLEESTIEVMVRIKLQQVGLLNFQHFMPSQLSGGMKKRAALARAMAMDPEILFFDEPSAGLDPIIAAGIDNLILNLKRALAVTIVVVTHELASAFLIADRIIVLDGGYIVGIAPHRRTETQQPPAHPAVLESCAGQRGRNRCGPPAVAHGPTVASDRNESQVVQMRAVMTAPARRCDDANPRACVGRTLRGNCCCLAGRHRRRHVGRDRPNRRRVTVSISNSVEAFKRERPSVMAGSESAASGAFRLIRRTRRESRSISSWIPGTPLKADSVAQAFQSGALERQLRRDFTRKRTLQPWLPRTASSTRLKASDLRRWATPSRL